MNGSGQITMTSSVEDVWNKLMDPVVLAKCIMGCDVLEPVSEGKYHANLSVGIAAVKGKYDAQIELADVKEQKGYRLIVHGEGAPGFVDAEGVIELSSEDDNRILLTYDYTANVGGKVAAVGQRMLGGVAKLLINDFFKRIKKEVEQTQRYA